MGNKRNLKEERGITLLALIITIIILVILALITVNAAYMSGIIQFGVNGAKDYAQAALDENKVMTETESYMSSVVEEIHRLMNNESKSEEEELPELQVGDYVAYVPDEATYKTDTALTGYTSSQSFTTDLSVGWRIYKKDADSITLVSASPVNVDFYLEGADGYNNAVWVLNEACRKMYSSTTYGGKARSIKIEDIEEVSSQPQRTPSPSTLEGDKAYYPNIFAYEDGQAVNGIMGTELGVSEQYTTYSGYSHADSITFTVSNYWFNLESDYLTDTYLSLLVQEEGSSAGYLPAYWVASRAVETRRGLLLFLRPLHRG